MTVSFPVALRLWARIGCLSFGGPAGQIALLHKELVETRHWITKDEFLRALNFCLLLPGPEAMQLATYCGWKLHGVRGGLAAGVLFVLPGSLIILGLSLLYAALGKLPLVEALFWGIKAAVLAIVLDALLKLAKQALRNTSDYGFAAFAFLALFVFALPFALVIALVALLGFLLFAVPQKQSAVVARPSMAETLRTLGVWLAVWLIPLLLLHVGWGAQHLQAKLASLFSVLAVVTFGGAYAVLASLGQSVVEAGGWLTPQEMMDGFGLAETTPGPLILVGQFVAFTAAKNTLDSLPQAFLASGIFLWMTFAPCFLWIFAGAPWIAWLEQSPRMKGLLKAVTAAAVGVILNLGLWFALHVVFATASRRDGLVPIWQPDWSRLDGGALLLAVVLSIILLWKKADILKTLGLGAAIGVIWQYLLI